MGLIPVSKVVNELVRHERIIVEKTKFAEALDVPSSKRVQWEALFTMGINSANAHYTKLLENWVQHRMGNDAGLGSLKKILISCNFIAAAGKFGMLNFTIIKCQNGWTYFCIISGIHYNVYRYFCGIHLESVGLMGLDEDVIKINLGFKQPKSILIFSICGIILVVLCSTCGET